MVLRLKKTHFAASQVPQGIRPLSHYLQTDPCDASVDVVAVLLRNERTYR